MNTYVVTVRLPNSGTTRMEIQARNCAQAKEIASVHGHVISVNPK